MRFEIDTEVNVKVTFIWDGTACVFVDRLTVAVSKEPVSSFLLYTFWGWVKNVVTVSK
jgi:hypothetical protein